MLGSLATAQNLMRWLVRRGPPQLRVSAHSFDLRQAHVAKTNGSAVGFGVAGIGDRLVYNVPYGATRRALLFLHHMRNKTGGS